MQERTCHNDGRPKRAQELDGGDGDALGGESGLAA